MNRHVNAISARLSLRAPQRESLEILARIAELVPLSKQYDLDALLSAVRAEFPSVDEFERDFPSLCFALATGVGKTRLMGAFIGYLHLAKGIRHFFVLAPNLTIYNKLIDDFTPNHPKYVFQGIAEFAQNPPEIITGDNYESGRGVRGTDLFGDTGIHVNIFNISKINSEVRGGKAPRIKRLSEYIGQSYFDYLAGLDDLVLLMDESHRYRASAGVRAINELKPILGLELTATPQVERGQQAEPFKNVIYSYPLASALADGFVKEPAVATRENFDADNYTSEQLEQLKLEDGIRIHENAKVDLQTYAQQYDLPIVKPFMLVVAQDTTHANDIVATFQDDAFFDGQYKDKAIIDEANNPDSIIRTGVVIGRDIPLEGKQNVVVQPDIVERITIKPDEAAEQGEIVFATPPEQEIATATLEVIKKYEKLPRSADLKSPEIQAQIIQEVKENYTPAQGVLEGVIEQPDIAEVVAKTTDLFIERTIDIPRIIVVPKGEVTSGFNDFDLEVSGIKLQPVADDILIQHLRTHERERLNDGTGIMIEERPENYLVRVLMDFDDIPYDENADLLYKLAGQVITHLRSYLPDEEAITNVLQYNQQRLAELIHTQMQEYAWEKMTDYEVQASKGFMTLRPGNFSIPSTENIRYFRDPVEDRQNIRGMLFNGFNRCLYPTQRFHSDSERRFAILLEDEQDDLKWFKPAEGYFRIYLSHNKPEGYEPDFVVETAEAKYLCEPKRASEMDDQEVLAKAKAAVTWCKRATEHELTHGGKPWSYLLIPHDEITANKTSQGLAAAYTRDED